MDDDDTVDRLLLKMIRAVFDHEGMEAALALTGPSLSARMAAEYTKLAGPQDGASPASLLFAVGFARGQRSALRRAAVALSDPRARGVEHEVVRLLADGAEVEDALRRASARPEPVETSGGSTIIPFPQKA